MEKLLDIAERTQRVEGVKAKPGPFVPIAGQRPRHRQYSEPQILDEGTPDMTDGQNDQSGQEQQEEDDLQSDGGREAQESTDEEKQDYHRNRKCFICRELGHIARSCPDREEASPSPKNKKAGNDRRRNGEPISLGLVSVLGPVVSEEDTDDMHCAMMMPEVEEEASSICSDGFTSPSESDCFTDPDSSKDGTSLIYQPNPSSMESILRPPDPEQALTVDRFGVASRVEPEGASPAFNDVLDSPEHSQIACATIVDASIIDGTNGHERVAEIDPSPLSTSISLNESAFHPFFNFIYEPKSKDESSYTHHSNSPYYPLSEFESRPNHNYDPCDEFLTLWDTKYHRPNQSACEDQKPQTNYDIHDEAGPTTELGGQTAQVSDTLYGNPTSRSALTTTNTHLDDIVSARPCDLYRKSRIPSLKQRSQVINSSHNCVMESVDLPEVPVSLYAVEFKSGGAT